MEATYGDAPYVKEMGARYGAVTIYFYIKDRRHSTSILLNDSACCNLFIVEDEIVKR